MKYLFVRSSSVIHGNCRHGLRVGRNLTQHFGLTRQQARAAIAQKLIQENEGLDPHRADLMASDFLETTGRLDVVIGDSQDLVAVYHGR